MHLTAKQIELLRVISAGNDDGTPTDLDEVIERVSYKPTKQSIQFSIRALVNHGLIEKGAQEKRRGRLRAIIRITPKGASMMGGPSKSEPSFVASVEEDETFQELTEFLEP